MEMHATMHISRVARVPSTTTRTHGSLAGRRSLSMNALKTQAKVFLVRGPENDENRAFLGIDHCISPDPDFTSLPNFHQQIECSGADHVFRICQVVATRAQNAAEREGRRMSVFDLDEVFN